MGYLKGKSSMIIFQKFGNMKFAYRNREFWCKGYYIDTVGKNESRIAITTLEAISQLFPAKINSLTIEVNKDYDLYETSLNLIKLGYKRVDFCEVQGSYSIRGDILEVFPINENEIFKIDFFGDTVEKIRTDNGSVDKLTVLMATDVIIEENEKEDILLIMRRYLWIALALLFVCVFALSACNDEKSQAEQRKIQHRHSERDRTRRRQESRMGEMDRQRRDKRQNRRDGQMAVRRSRHIHEYILATEEFPVLRRDDKLVPAF